MVQKSAQGVIGHALGSPLSVESFRELVCQPGKILALSAKARQGVKRSRKTVEEVLNSGRLVYGINTGFGRFAEVKISNDQIDELQENLLMSHAVGVGGELSPMEVRGVLLLRIQSLLQGHSGVREELMDQLLEIFNRGVIPVVPEQGSCGASGDLAPLSHLALVAIGKGKARLLMGNTYEKVSPVMSGLAALKKVDLKPLGLVSKEGLALINGTQVMTALGALSIARLENVVRSADIIGALTLEGLKGSKTPFHRCIQEVRPHPGQKIVAENLMKLLANSEIMNSHKDCHKVQDAYSLRCMPQVHGAARDALGFAKTVVEREMNAVTDNPLIFPELTADQRVLSGGNFHGQPVAQVLDFLAIGATDLASISERRIERLLNPDLSELPAFLAYAEGVHSGFMITQVTAASLVSESKSLCYPASADSIPTSANKEDHVSMGTTSARKLRTLVSNLESVLAIELLCAAKALEYHRPLHSSPGVEAAYAALRKVVKTLTKDREMGADLQNARDFITQGVLVDVVQKKIGPIN